MMGWMRVAGRLGLALCVASMSACLKDDNGSSQSQTGIGANTPLIWTNQATTATGTNVNTPLSDVWVDATTVTATGAGAILPSIDEITYGFPRLLLPVGDPNLAHPIMTHSSARAILDPEDGLLKLINNHRLQTLGQNINPGAGGGGLGIPIGGFVVTAIPPSGKLRKNARAHCKHYGRFHPGAFPAGANAEGDSLNAGNVQVINNVSTPAGRLRKGNLTVSNGVTFQECRAAANLTTAQTVFDAMLNGGSVVLTSTGYSYIGIGHWPQGAAGEYYWTIILTGSVSPIN